MNQKEKYIDKLREAKKGEYVMLGDYTSMKKKTLFKHLFCGYEWCTSPDNMLRSKKGCPQCSGNARTSTSKFVEDVLQAVGDEYVVKGEYVNARTPIAVNHIKCGSTFYPTPFSFLSTGTRCANCYGKVARTLQEAKLEIAGLTNSEYLVMDVPISEGKVSVTHSICGYDWEVSINNFINKGSRCPRCAGNERLSDSSAKKKLFDKYGGDYIMLESYGGYLKLHKCRHVKCGHEWDITFGNLITGRECPACFQTSKGERLVSSLLTAQEVTFISQHIFPDCHYKRGLRFDFYLPSIQTVIEYDGEQHYRPVNFGGRLESVSIKEYNLTKIRDNIKNEYCESKGIHLVRIPYTATEKEIKEIIATLSRK